MLFNSFVFVGLLLVTFALYYLPLLRRFQISILIISSLIFYAYNQPTLVLLLLFSSFINIISSYYVVYGKDVNKKTVAVSGVALNLAVLAFFKYSPLFSRTFFNETGSIGEFLLTIPLPIGISFFTFQGISLVVDVYKGKYFENKEVIPVSFIEHARRIMFFISFFPQLISGPIVKAHEFIPQIGVKRFSDIEWEECFRRLVLGYFLKMVVADNLKEFTYFIEFPYFQAVSTMGLIALLFGYGCQIFADFAGYSMIAIGLAKLFGYNFLENFNFPYISTSFKEFWKRWHISLSTFLMEYLYFPLGGNRKGKVRTYVNLMITMVLGGLWHGAAWSYAVWGTFHGLALAVERFISDNVKMKSSQVLEFMKGVLVFFFVTLAWLLFKLPDFSHVIEYFKTIFSSSFFGYSSLILNIAIYSVPIVLYHAHYLAKQRGFISIRRLEFVPYGIMLFMIISNSGPSGSFIYFQF
jgi:alginate O-acetyltransferase complex protein AlgI